MAIYKEGATLENEEKTNRQAEVQTAEKKQVFTLEQVMEMLKKEREGTEHGTGNETKETE